MIFRNGTLSGRVLNVAVNGEHALAFRLPIERHSGGFDLITYDAAADFLGSLER